MVSERLRARLGGLMLGLGVMLGRTGLSPNFFTIAGFVGVVVSAAVLAAGYPQVAGLLLMASLLVDSLDGAVARATGQITAFGAFLDSTLDRWAEVAIFFGMLVFLRNSWIDQALIFAALSSSLLVSYTRARAESIGVQCKEGMFTRFERMAVVVLGLLFVQLTLANSVIAALAALTAVQRIAFVWRHTRGR